MITQPSGQALPRAPSPVRVALMTPYGIDNGGIRHLAAVAKQCGNPVRTVFFKQWRNNNIEPPTDRELELLLGLLAEFKPKLVGLGFGSPYFKLVRAWAPLIRQRTGAGIVLGGIHPTLMPEACIPWADYICIGEGEEAFAEFLQQLNQGLSVNAVPNFWLKHDNVVIRNEVRPLCNDLDRLPFRDFDADEKFFIDDNKIMPGEPLVAASLLRVHASRGCPFQCAFCYNSSLRAVYGSRGNYYRRRSVGSVIAEIQAARALLPRVRRIKLDDDSFVHSSAWIAEFADRYPREVGLTFDLMLNPEAVSETSLWQLKKAGLENVQVGVQSAGANESECLYQRKDPNRTVRKFSRLNRLLQLDVVYDIIFDHPLSCGADKEKLLDLLLELSRPFKIYLYSLTVFPRSEVQRQLQAAGLITDADVEGEATKSFRQFRLTLDWPRPALEEFYICLTILAAKEFIPRSLVQWLRRRPWLRRHTAALRLFAQAANLIKMATIGFTMLRRGDLTLVKFREYASFKRMIFQ